MLVEQFRVIFLESYEDTNSEFCDVKSRGSYSYHSALASYCRF